MEDSISAIITNHHLQRDRNASEETSRQKPPSGELGNHLQRDKNTSEETSHQTLETCGNNLLQNSESVATLRKTEYDLCEARMTQHSCPVKKRPLRDIVEHLQLHLTKTFDTVHVPRVECANGANHCKTIEKGDREEKLAVNTTCTSMEVNGGNIAADEIPNLKIRASLWGRNDSTRDSSQTISNNDSEQSIDKKDNVNKEKGGGGIIEEEMDDMDDMSDMDSKDGLNETDPLDNQSGDDDLEYDFDENDDENVDDTLDQKSHSDNLREFARKIQSVTVPVDGKYQCKMCTLVSKYRNRVALHIKRTHYCDFCIDFYPKDELPDHLRSHDEKGKVRQCRFCNDEFQSAIKLHSHDCSFSKRANLFYHCKICKAMFSSRDSLQSHIRSHNPDNFECDWHKQVCQLCGFVFLGRQTLVRHMAKRDCQHCGMVAVSSCQYQKHLLSSHNSGAYRCHKCDVQMMSQHSFVDHINERQCSGCNETIEPDCEYVKHIKLCKSGIQPSEDLQEFSCFKCGVILKDTYIYDLHVRDHIQNPLKNTCKDCGQNFQQNFDYAIHMSRRTCPQCNAKFNPLCTWKNHICLKIDPPTVSCPKCHLVFSKASSYRKHCKSLRCHCCPKLSFSSVCELNKHYDEEHGGLVKPLELYDEDILASTSKATSTPVKNYSDYGDNFEEESEDAVIKDEPQDQTDPEYLESDGNRLDSSLTYKECPHCDTYRGPMTYSKLRRHLQGSKCSICMKHVSPCCQMNSHYVQCAFALAPTEENKPLLEKTANDAVECPLCKMKLKALSGLKSHLRMVPSPCKECNEVFKTPCVLRLHQRETLHGQRDCVCPICNKGFQYSRDLKKHLLIHSGERPYDCLLCGNTYKNPGHLSYHLKVQHGGARPYKCKYCGRGFGAQSGCNKHERRHETETDYKCMNCGMSFIAAHSLTKHITTKVCKQEGKEFIEQELPKKEPKKRIRKYVPKSQRKAKPATAEMSGDQLQQAQQQGLAMLQQCLSFNMSEGQTAAGGAPSFPALPANWPLMLPVRGIDGAAGAATSAAASEEGGGWPKQKAATARSDEEDDDDEEEDEDGGEEEVDREERAAKMRENSDEQNAPKIARFSIKREMNEDDNDECDDGENAPKKQRFTIKTEDNADGDQKNDEEENASQKTRFTIKTGNEDSETGVEIVSYNIKQVIKTEPLDENEFTNTSQKDTEEIKKVKPLVIKIEKD